MDFRIHFPAPPLAHFVESMVFYEGLPPSHSVERLLPDGAAHLLIELADRPQFVFDNETLLAKQRCTHSWISGMHTDFLSISAEPHSSMFVIRFRPTGMRPFLCLPMCLLNNQVVPADGILGREAEFLREQLLEADNPAAKFQAAEAWLWTQFSPTEVPAQVAQFAAAAIGQSPTLGGIQRIVDKTGYSQKHLIQLFREHIGLAPKAFQRVLRFNRVLQEIETRREIVWSELAYDCGFADQAHFIREFRRFAGFNPGDFLKERRHFTNYVVIR